ncbi:MAG: hypothetical protein H6Q41_5585, partial [Deltaproteobacteria bacterium]|nr:hypothetical protein [Deltaproteobacteria bacterium]
RLNIDFLFFDAYTYERTVQGSLGI